MTRRAGLLALIPFLAGQAPAEAQSALGPPTSEPEPVQAGVAPPVGGFDYGLDVLHYDFEISLVEGADWFAGRANIRFTPAEARAERPYPYALDLTGLHVDEVTVDGAPVEFGLEGGRVYFAGPSDAAAGSEYVVGVSYRGFPDDGLIIGETGHGTPSVFADNWPNRARFWIPTVDHPSDKATARFTVHAPQAWSVVAPGALIGGEARVTGTDALGGGGGRRTWTWEIGVPVSPYNLVIGATEFAVHTVGLGACRNAPESPREDRCAEVTSWSFPQDADSARAKFRRAADMVEHFTWTVGLYPFEKLANVQSATRFGGMENASAIFYSERGVATSSDDGVVSHEIAHQWFGDAITEAEWSHLWLSEGFATYFGALYFLDRVGPDDFRRRMEAARQRYVESDDVDRPVVRREESLYDLLNRNNYQKGGWVLHMLRSEIGELDFGQVIRTWYNRYKFQTVLTEDFRAVVEEVTERDLGWFFDQWLYEPGHPQLEVTWEWDDEANEVVVSVEQTQPADWPTFRFDSSIELRHSGGAARRGVQIRERSHTFRLPFVMEPVAVELDPDAWVLKTIETIRR